MGLTEYIGMATTCPSPIEGAKHAFMVKGELKVRMPNPHRGDIDISLLKEILRQANLDWTDWESAA